MKLIITTLLLCITSVASAQSLPLVNGPIQWGIGTMVRLSIQADGVEQFGGPEIDANYNPQDLTNGTQPGH